jgi:hypothetical protein
MNKPYVELPKIRSWSDFTRFTRRSLKWSDWVFRGQRESSWELKTSLERAADDLHIPYSDLPAIEQGMLRKYRRNYAYYGTVEPKADSHIEWLSIMQHHGAPTRLLDFTYSPYVALFFAICDAQVTSACAIWAINTAWLNSKYEELHQAEYRTAMEKDISEEYQEWHKVILSDRTPFLFGINPFRLNVRLNVQQGCFLMPIDLTQTFMANLENTITSRNETANITKLNIHCSKSLIKDTYAHLNRMNINNSSLFPGLDGFTKSMKMYMAARGSIHSDRTTFA